MSPTTPVYALRYPASSDPADVPTDMGELATDVEAKLLTAGVTYGTTPPATPVDGQLWAYPADTTNGVMWMFRYRSASASAYKWEFVGGPPLVADDLTTITGVTSTTYVALGPTVTVPRAGDYDWHFECHVTNNTAGAASTVSAKLGAAAASDNDAASGYFPTVAGWEVAVSRSRRAPGLAAASAISLHCKVNIGQGGFRLRTLALVPARVS